MLLFFPNGFSKKSKPISCNFEDQNDKVKLCMTFEVEVTKEEAKRITQASQSNIESEQNPDSEVVEENQMFVDGFTPLIP